MHPDYFQDRGHCCEEPGTDEHEAEIDVQALDPSAQLLDPVPEGLLFKLARPMGRNGMMILHGARLTRLSSVATPERCGELPFSWHSRRWRCLRLVN
jgi:hypothetical protein